MIPSFIQKDLANLCTFTSSAGDAILELYVYLIIPQIYNKWYILLWILLSFFCCICPFPSTLGFGDGAGGTEEAAEVFELSHIYPLGAPGSL